jgi:hypothetical protein
MVTVIISRLIPQTYDPMKLESIFVGVSLDIDFMMFVIHWRSTDILEESVSMGSQTPWRLLTIQEIADIMKSIFVESHTKVESICIG